MRIEITFHGPFRVETGSARDGIAATVDRDELVPASSVKGVMRASAKALLPSRLELVDDVFGDATENGPRRASPWHWSAAVFDTEPAYEHRARIAIDPTTGAARPEFFFLGEEVWATAATVDITQHRRLDPDTRDRHLTVLACSAAGVHALGADRRRGLGWVSVRPVDPPLDEAMLAKLEDLGPGSAATSGGPRA